MSLLLTTAAEAAEPESPFPSAGWDGDAAFGPQPSASEGVPRVLNDRARVMLESLPGYFWEDPYVLGFVRAMSAEAERLEAFMESLRVQWEPKNATDEFGILGLWEWHLGLPVRPAGVALADRQRLAQARLSRLRIESGADWQDAVTLALGSAAWSYRESPTMDYTVEVTIPQTLGSYTAGQVYALIRAVTPAHLALALAYGQHFIVGVSKIGVDPL